MAYLQSADCEQNFISWFKFMFLRFGTISIFPSREEVNKTMPKDYNVKCPNTRVGGSEWVLGFSVVCP